jgi:hypothetical protein
MSINRSTFGRHKLTNNREQIAKQSLNTILLQDLEQAKSKIKHQLQLFSNDNNCFYSTNDIIKHFYETTFKSISIYCDQQVEITTYHNLIPSFVLFCVLFDIKLPWSSNSFNGPLIQLEQDIFQMINLLETNNFKFTIMLRISVFLLVSNSLFSQDFNIKKFKEIINCIKIDTKSENDKLSLILWSNQIYNILFDFLNFKMYV